MTLWKEGRVCAGFSPRLPDYAIRYWLEQLKVALPCKNAPLFLDVGAGDGRLTLLLLRAYSTQGMAVEIQTNKAVWGQIQKEYQNFELYDGLLQDAFSGEYSSKKQFDFIVLAEVFEHIPPNDVAVFLKSLHNVLSDDGTVFLTTPNRVVQGPAELTPIWYEKTPYGHYKHYTYSELEQIFQDAGFQVLWHSFECYTFKRSVYNKLFYPISRMDARLLSSKKIPQCLRSLYRVVSWLPLQLMKSFFWCLSWFVYFVERFFVSKANGATIIVCLKKKQ